MVFIEHQYSQDSVSILKKITIELQKFELKQLK